MGQIYLVHRYLKIYSGQVEKKPFSSESTYRVSEWVSGSTKGLLRILWILMNQAWELHATIGTH